MMDAKARQDCIKEIKLLQVNILFRALLPMNIFDSSYAL